MQAPTYFDPSSEQRVAYAKRAGRVLVGLIETAGDQDRLAAYLRCSSLIKQVMSEEIELPIRGLNTLRPLEEEGLLDLRRPSILVHALVIFLNPLSGALSSEYENELLDLERMRPGSDLPEGGGPGVRPYI